MTLQTLENLFSVILRFTIKKCYYCLYTLSITSCTFPKILDFKEAFWKPALTSCPFTTLMTSNQKVIFHGSMKNKWWNDKLTLYRWSLGCTAIPVSPSIVSIRVVATSIFSSENKLKIYLTQLAEVSWTIFLMTSLYWLAQFFKYFVLPPNPTSCDCLQWHIQSFWADRYINRIHEGVTMLGVEQVHFPNLCLQML